MWDPRPKRFTRAAVKTWYVGCGHPTMMRDSLQWLNMRMCVWIYYVYIYIDIYNSIILYISACWGLGSVAVIPQFLTLVSISIHESMTMPRYQLDAVWDTPNFHLRRACSPDFLSSQRYTVPYAPRPSLTGWIKAEKFSTMENRSLDISV